VPHLSTTPWKLMGGRSVAPLILIPSTRWWWVVGATPRPLYPQRRGSGYPVDRGWVNPTDGLDAVVKRNITVAGNRTLVVGPYPIALLSFHMYWLCEKWEFVKPSVLMVFSSIVMSLVRARNGCNGQTGSDRGRRRPRQGVFETCLRSYHQRSRPAVLAIDESRPVEIDTRIENARVRRKSERRFVWSVHLIR
jgi:hypothetical protein